MADGLASSVTVSGDAKHVYLVDERGAIVSTHDTLAAASEAKRCACKGTRRLGRMVLDGAPGEIECPWCSEVTHG